MTSKWRARLKTEAWSNYKLKVRAIVSDEAQTGGSFKDSTSHYGSDKAETTKENKNIFLGSKMKLMRFHVITMF